MSTFALGAMSTVALPGAFLAVVAPSASAVEIGAPTLGTDQLSGDTALDAARDVRSAAPGRPGPATS